MIAIRLWTPSDIDYVAKSVKREGWGYVKRDVERCWQFEPNGCYIAEVQGKPVGHVFSISYDRIGWIGLLIVNPRERGKGIGATLMQAAIRHLEKIGAETIQLEAVEKAVALYKRLGFVEEFDSLRFSKQLKQKEEEKPKLSQRTEMFHIKEENLKNIAKFDSKYFGANRLRVLQSLFEDQTEQCFVAMAKQKTLGYIMSRKIQNANWIGPWVSKNSETAEKLLFACIEAIGGEEIELRLGMPILNTNGIKLMKKLDFQQTSKSIRMVWGKRRHKGNIKGIYGIAGPEKG